MSALEGGKRMKTKRGMRFMTIAGLLAVLGLASGARAQEPIPLKRVPKAVIDSAKAKFPGTVIKAASEETEDGKPPVFELEMKHRRHNVQVTFKDDGTVVQVQTDVPTKELPKVVLRAVSRRFPDASLRAVEAVKTGPEVKEKADHYEFYLLKANNRPALVKVAPDGKILYPPEKKPRKRDNRGIQQAEVSPVGR
jgi:hypothetical protein